MKKIKNWCRSVKDMIVNPRRFFSSVTPDCNAENSMLKAFAYGMLGGLLVLGSQLMGGAQITINSLFIAAVIIPVMAVTLLFVFGGLLMLVSEITDGERNWDVAVKGLASAFFVYPLILLVNSLAFNCISLIVISIIGDAYILFLFYNIAVYCMRGRRTAVIVIVGIFALFLATVYLSDYMAGWLLMKNTGVAIYCLGYFA